MRHRISCFFLILCSLLRAQAQTKISGIITQNNKPLEKVTISVLDLRDSSILSYTLTNEQGKFELVKLPHNQQLLLFASHINANTFTQDFKLDIKEQYDFGTIALENRSIKEVLVKALPPVRLNKDTLEYHTNYFKTRPQANVEELLRQLPGLQVNMDGTIYYEGQEVSQVKVNGKDFFTNDSRIATRNFDASLVKTVQVYRDKGESKKIVDDERNLPITINLKFKKEFLRTDFGKIYASGGTRERYEAGALFNTFRDTLQVSFIGFGNNINRQSFDYNELNQHAGLGRAENYGFGDFGGQNYWGKANDIGAGVNFNNDWGKKTKLNLMYFLKHNDNSNESFNQADAIFDGVRQLGTYQEQTDKKRLEHRFNSLFRQRFDSTAFFEFSPSLTLGNSKQESRGYEEQSDMQQKLSESVNENANTAAERGYAHRLFIEKQIHPKHLFSLTNQVSFNTTNGDEEIKNSIRMFNTSDDDKNYQLLNINKEKSNNTHSSIAYYNKVWDKLNFDWYLTYNTNRNKPAMQTFYGLGNDLPVRHSEFENNYQLYTQDVISGIKFYWKPKKDWVVNFGTAFQVKDNHFDFYDVGQTNDNKKNYWLPNINIRYKSLEVSWSKDVNSPSTNGIWTQYNDLNPIRVRLPSLYFDNVVTQDMSIGFNKFTQKLQLVVRASAQYNDKSIGHRNWRDNTTGKYTSQSYQTGSKVSGRMYGQLRYQVKSSKAWTIYTSTSPQYFMSEQHQEANDIPNRSINQQLRLSQELSIVWNNRISISPKYQFGFDINRNSVNNNPDFMGSNYKTHKIAAGVELLPVKGFSMQATYSLENRASAINERKNYHLLTSSLYYNFKNESQIKLSAFDILNQNSNSYWGSIGNTTYYSSNITLKQYFLLGYVYKFNFIKHKS